MKRPIGLIFLISLVMNAEADCYDGINLKTMDSRCAEKLAKIRKCDALLKEMKSVDFIIDNCDAFNLTDFINSLKNQKKIQIISCESDNGNLLRPRKISCKSNLKKYRLKKRGLSFMGNRIEMTFTYEDTTKCDALFIEEEPMIWTLSKWKCFEEEKPKSSASTPLPSSAVSSAKVNTEIRESEMAIEHKADLLHKVNLSNDPVKSANATHPVTKQQATQKVLGMDYRDFETMCIIILVILVSILIAMIIFIVRDYRLQKKNKKNVRNRRLASVRPENTVRIQAIPNHYVLK